MQHPSRPLPETSRSGDSTLALDAPGLALRLYQRDGASVVEAAGELDLQVVPMTAALLRSTATRVLVFDLYGVTFMDARGLAMLAACCRAATRAGGTVRVARPSCQVRKLLAMTRMDQAVTIFDSVDEALAASS